MQPLGGSGSTLVVATVEAAKQAGKQYASSSGEPPEVSSAEAVKQAKQSSNEPVVASSKAAKRPSNQQAPAEPATARAAECDSADDEPARAGRCVGAKLQSSSRPPSTCLACPPYNRHVAHTYAWPACSKQCDPKRNAKAVTPPEGPSLALPAAKVPKKAVNEAPPAAKEATKLRTKAFVAASHQASSSQAAPLSTYLQPIQP